MNLKKKLAATAALLAIGASGTAYAVPTTWTDTISFSNQLITPGNSASYTHTLDNFTAGVDTVSAYSITFNLFDDKYDTVRGWGFQFELAEWAVIRQADVMTDWFFDLSGNTEQGHWAAAGRAQLNSTGSLEVEVSSWFGDFYLGGSTLVARGNDNSVPEPATLALFGAVLLGFGLTRRKRLESR